MWFRDSGAGGYSIAGVSDPGTGASVGGGGSAGVPGGATGGAGGGAAGGVPLCGGQSDAAPGGVSRSDAAEGDRVAGGVVRLCVGQCSVCGAVSGSVVGVGESITLLVLPADY